MRMSDWSSDGCSSDVLLDADAVAGAVDELLAPTGVGDDAAGRCVDGFARGPDRGRGDCGLLGAEQHGVGLGHLRVGLTQRSEEHTSELQSLMRISYAVFCLKKKT